MLYTRLKASFRKGNAGQAKPDLNDVFELLVEVMLYAVYTPKSISQKGQCWTGKARPENMFEHLLEAMGCTVFIPETCFVCFTLKGMV